MKELPQWACGLLVSVPFSTFGSHEFDSRVRVFFRAIFTFPNPSLSSTSHGRLAWHDILQVTTVFRQLFTLRQTHSGT